MARYPVALMTQLSIGLSLDRLGSYSRCRADPPDVDAALNIAEGRVGRNRQAWAPILLELAGIPTLVSEAGVPIPNRCLRESPGQEKNAVLPGSFLLFVKPRWEGTASAIRRASQVADRDALGCADFKFDRGGEVIVSQVWREPDPLGDDAL